MSAPVTDTAAMLDALPAAAAVVGRGSSPRAAPHVLRHGHPVWWRERDLALLDRLYPRLGASRLAPILHRSKAAIRQRAHLRGLRYVPKAAR